MKMTSSKKVTEVASTVKQELVNYPCLVVTASQVFPLREPIGKTKAMARVVLNDQLQMTGIRIVEGVTGLFVAYPNDPGYKGEDYRSLFYPVTRSLRDHIEQILLSQYAEALKG